MLAYNANSDYTKTHRSTMRVFIFIIFIAVLGTNAATAQGLTESDSVVTPELQSRLNQRSAIVPLDSLTQTAPDSSWSAEPMRLLILPANIATGEAQEVLAEVMQMARDFLFGLNSIEVMMITKPQNFPGAPDLNPGDPVPDVLVKKLARHFDAEELLLLEIVRFSQTESADAPVRQKFVGDYCRQIGRQVIRFFQKSASDSANEAKSYVTELEMRFMMADGKTGDSINEFLLTSSQPSGSRSNSKSAALAQLKSLALAEFKKFYLPGSELAAFHSGKWTLPAGSNVGIYAGMEMELLAPRSWIYAAASDSVNAGDQMALAYITTAGVTQSQLKIVRQWHPIDRGTWAVEHQGSVIGLQLVFQPPSTPAFNSMGLQLHLSPIRSADLGLGVRYIRVRDDLAGLNHGFGLTGFFLGRLVNGHRIDFGLSSKLGCDFPFRKDDAGNTVSVVSLSAALGFCTEILLSAHQDLVLTIGYRFATRSHKWEYSQDDQNYPARVAHCWGQLSRWRSPRHRPPIA